MTNAFLTGSPACKLGTVDDGGCVRIVTISLAACLRKSVKFTSGMGMVCGIKVTVSHIRVVRVRGK